MRVSHESAVASHHPPSLSVALPGHAPPEEGILGDMLSPDMPAHSRTAHSSAPKPLLTASQFSCGTSVHLVNSPPLPTWAQGVEASPRALRRPWERPRTLPSRHAFVLSPRITQQIVPSASCWDSDAGYAHSRSRETNRIGMGRFIAFPSWRSICLKILIEHLQMEHPHARKLCQGHRGGRKAQTPCPNEAYCLAEETDNNYGCSDSLLE